MRQYGDTNEHRLRGASGEVCGDHAQGFSAVARSREIGNTPMTRIPTEIKKTGPGRMTITWDDGHVSLLPIHYLRSECMCAGCVSEITGQRILDPRTIPEDITITGAEHVGRYGVKFYFTDNHGDGIYTWERLREICPCDQCKGQRATRG